MSDLLVPHDDHDLTAPEMHPTDQNPAAVYVAGLASEHSRRNMWRYLNQIAELLTGGRQDAWSLEWRALRYQHVAAIRARLQDDYAPSTVNGMLSALRSTLATAWRLGQMSAEDYHRAVDVNSVKGETLPAGRDLAQGEILALVNACDGDDGPAGVRDAAIIGVLYTGGLRRSEVVALDVSDYDQETGRLAVRAGKGHKARTVYVTNGAQDALSDWRALRGAAAGALFMPINKGGVIQPRRMSSQAVYNLLKKRADEAGVNDFSPHDFRRTFVGDLLDRGADIVTVQKLAGHASPTTTSRYDRRDEEVKREAASKLHFPYRRRN